MLSLVPQRGMHLSDIDELNLALLTVPADAFIDLSPTLAPAGELLGAYTTDGVHLSSAAYRVWAQELRTVLNSHGSSVVHDGTRTPPSIGGRSLARIK